MQTPNGTFIEPSFQEILLVRGNRLSRRRGRHNLVWVVAGDPVPQRALERVSGNDDGASDGLVIESQVGLSVGCIGTVAMKTVFGQDRSYLEAEIDGRWSVG